MPLGECVKEGDDWVVSRLFIPGVGVAEGTGDVIAEFTDLDQAQPDVHFYFANHRGDTLVVVNENADQEAWFDYDAFGNVYEQTGSFEPRFTFSTKEYLPEADLYLYAYRVYDPVAGRWTQRDPLDYYDSPNLYQFCGNNPLLMLDILGLAKWIIPSKTMETAKKRIEGTKRGKAVIERCDDKYEVVEIIEKKGSGKANYDISADGKKATITLDPDMYNKELYYLDTPKDPNDESLKSCTAPTSPERFLSHELGHIHNIDKYKGNYQNIIDNENEIMRELGEPDRDPYSARYPPPKP